MIFLFVGVGLWFTVGTGFFQVRRFGALFTGTFGRMFDKKKTSNITPFQAMATALASTVGTGNVAGVATAITAGGPGAIFWMWVSAALGMMTKYAEVFLSVKFRRRDKNGLYYGGPMYVIEDGLGSRWKWLAVLFSIFGVCASLGMGNLTQVNTMADALRDSFSIPPIVTGAVTLLIAGIVILGGVKSIARASELLVPFMAGLYILLCVLVLVLCRDAVYPALRAIVLEAFRPGAVLGGAAGYTVQRAMRFGVGRGVFSNEAGLGSAPIAHASADCKSPEDQALWGAAEVFIDTLLICTLTALVILCSGVYQPSAVITLDGAPLTSAAFSAALGDWGGGAVSICTALFALASILGWSLYGERCCEHLFSSPAARKIYRFAYILLLLPGACLRIDLVWALADVLNSLMAGPNIVCLLALSGVVFRATRRAERFPARIAQRRAS